MQNSHLDWARVKCGAQGAGKVGKSKVRESLCGVKVQVMREVQGAEWRLMLHKWGLATEEVVVMSTIAGCRVLANWDVYVGNLNTDK